MSSPNHAELRSSLQVLTSYALQSLAAGESVSQLARDYGTTRQSIMRLRNKAASG